MESPVEKPSERDIKITKYNNYLKIYSTPRRFINRTREVGYFTISPEESTARILNVTSQNNESISINVRSSYYGELKDYHYFIKSIDDLLKWVIVEGGCNFDDVLRIKFDPKRLIFYATSGQLGIQDKFHNISFQIINNGLYCSRSQGNFDQLFNQSLAMILYVRDIIEYIAFELIELNPKFDNYTLANKHNGYIKTLQ